MKGYLNPVFTLGESQTIETNNGKVIDLLRTADGVEIYVDGEGEGHKVIMIRKHVVSKD